MSKFIYRDVYNFLLDYIKKNGNEPSLKLPSERLLATKFNTSRRPIKSAYDKLISKGIVESIYGKGYFVKEKIRTSTSEKQISNEYSIYLIIPEIATTFSQNIVRGAIDFCDEKNINLLIQMSCNNEQKENNLIRNASKSGAKGIVLFPIDNQNKYSEELLKLSLTKYPLTIIDRLAMNINASFVSTDNHDAMIKAVEFLAKKNFKNIAFFTPPIKTATTCLERIDGFNEGITKVFGSNKPHNLLALSDNKFKNEKIIQDYLEINKDIDVIIISGVHAESLVIAAQNLDLKIPQDVKIMIIDNELTQFECEKLQPFILEQQGHEMGYRAVKLLVNQMYGDLKIKTQKLDVQIYSY